jgi:hypothetical protein
MKTTFWKLLNERKIEIPIIQRDYAQGQIGKEKLRERFLAELKRSLDKPEQPITLDFIYGDLNGERLQPLDGQQRLTTLWLLHWYVAFRAGTLCESKGIFKRFTYETRISSREFCERVSEYNGDNNTKHIVTDIQNQTWFFSSWKQDPTIQAMLNMLGGTPFKDRKGNEIIDGVEEIFADTDAETFKNYWHLLIGKDCPINFNSEDLNDLNSSDELYIKMNARGKQLSDFENFKADLVGHLRSLNEETGNLGFTYKFERKLDTNYADIFWQNRSKQFDIDEIYLTFFNRYFFNRLIVAKDATGAYCYTQEEVQNLSSFKELYKDESKEATKNERGYFSFDPYNPKDKEGKELFKEEFYTVLSRMLDNYITAPAGIISTLMQPSWGNNDLTFIPQYVEKVGDAIAIRSITQPHRVIFHAISRYFELYSYEESSFKQWMRVVWNITENIHIETVEAMIGAMRLIDELSVYSHDIYSALADSERLNIKSDTAKEQLKEECIKALLLLSTNAEQWTPLITEAEKFPSLKGCIRVLFDDAIQDYDVAQQRWDAIKRMFSEDGNIKEEYSENARLLKATVSHIQNPNVLWNRRIFYNKKETWQQWLTNDDYLNAMRITLSDKDLSVSDNAEVQNTWYRSLIETNLLNYTSKEMPDCRIRHNTSWHIAIYPPRSSDGIVLDATVRDKILTELLNEGQITLVENGGIPIPDTHFFYGWNIWFRNAGNSFVWKSNGEIWSVDPKNQWQEIKCLFKEADLDKEDIIEFINKLSSTN